MSDSDSSDSDYDVEMHLKPSKVRAKLINTEDQDILGNFDDSRSKKKVKPNNDDSDEDNVDNDDDSDDEKEPIDDKAYELANFEDDDYEMKKIEVESSSSEEEGEEEEEEEKDKKKPAVLAKKIKEKKGPPTSDISSEQMKKLMTGAKSTRLVMYVTNLSFDTTKDMLESHFSDAGSVKSVRIPKIRKAGFAFVEMEDADSFQKAFSLHNTMLNNKQIKIQLSEAGKKKSANKKNILKQKNRKLAEMRNEDKQFLKSGKDFGKTKIAKKRAIVRAKQMKAQKV